MGELYQQAIVLLQQLISTPSYSKYEDGTAELIARFLLENGIEPNRLKNNVWAVNQYFDPAKPVLLLNSHHDTVNPNPQYTKDPFTPVVENGRLYGLGSNDAGGCLVSLLATFLYFYSQPHLSYNIVIALTAEEEISGYDGIELLLQDNDFKNSIHLGFSPHHNGPAACIVGEPTQMNLAIAEKGLMVLDCVAEGRAGHAARNEGDNAIYKAMKDIQWLSTYQFEKVSEWLGPVKMSVTVVNTDNRAHNMVPATCNFVVDVRITELYSHEEIFDTINKHVSSSVTPRSMRLRATGIAIDHPLVQAGLQLGKHCYGSPTSSDKALMPFAALKCGPGDSARSHTADEYIYLAEIETGIAEYIQMITCLMQATTPQS